MRTNNQKDDQISELSYTPSNSDVNGAKTGEECTLQDEGSNDSSGFTEIYEDIVEEIYI